MQYAHAPHTKALTAAIAALCALALAALLTPATARAQSGDVLTPLVDFGDDLYVTEQLRKHQGPSRYDRLTEELVLQQMYKDNPNLSAQTAQFQILAFRKAREAARTSEQDKYNNGGHSMEDNWLQAVEVVQGTPGLGTEAKFLVQAVRTLGRAGLVAAGGVEGSPYDNTQYLTMTDQANNYAQTARRAGEIWTDSRRLGRDNRAFEVAHSALYQAHDDCSIRCNADQIIQSSAALQDQAFIRSIVDQSTGQIREDIKTATGQIRLDISSLRGYVRTEFANLHAEIDEIQTGLGAISDAQAQHQSEFRLFVAQYEHDQQYRVEQERIAKEQERLAQERQTVIQGAQSSVYLLSTLIGAADPKLGRDVSTVGNSLIQIADTSNQLVTLLSKGAEIFANPLNYFNLVTMGANIVSAVLPVIGIFGTDDTGPAPDQMILDEIGKTREDVENLRVEMHDRFDRIDKGLNQLFGSTMEQFNKVNVSLGRIEGDLTTVRTSLSKLQLSVDALGANMHQVTSDLGRREIWHKIDEGLNWKRIQRNVPMSPTDYIGFNSFYFTWATADSLDSVATGPSNRPTDDASLYGQLRGFPLETNLNYVNRAVRDRFGSPIFDTDELVNPRDWAIGGRAFGRLALDWPELAANSDPARFDRIAERGDQLEANLRMISESPALIERLVNNYKRKKEELETSIAGVESQFASDTGTPTGVIFGGPDFALPADQLAPFDAVVPCEGTANGLTPPDNAAAWFKAPALVSRRLGGGSVRLCYDARWVETRGDVTPTDPDNEFDDPGEGWGRLEVTVKGQYRSGTGEWRTIGTRVYKRAQESEVCTIRWDVDERNKPIKIQTCTAADQRMRADWSSLRNVIGGASLTTSFDEDVVSIARADATARQAAYQRSLYQRIVEALDAEGPLRNRALALGGAQALLVDVVRLGFPRALAGDQLLSSLVDGSDAIYDHEGVRQAYLVGSAGAPGANVRGFLHTNGDGRVDDLAARLADYTSKIAAGDYNEYQTLVSRTKREVKIAKGLGFEPAGGTPVVPQQPAGNGQSAGGNGGGSSSTGGGGGGGGGGTTDGGRVDDQRGGDTSAPRIVVRGRALRADRKRIVKLSVTCPASEPGGCKGSVSLVTARPVKLRAAAKRKKARPLALGNGRFSLRGGQKKTVRVKLSRKGAALLRKKKKLAAKATVRMTDDAGNAASRVIAVKLMAARKRR